MQIDCRTFEIYSNSGWCRVKVYREGMSFIELIALKAGCDKGTYRFYGGKPKVLSTRHGTEELLGKGQQWKSIYSVFLSGLGASVWWLNKDHMYDEVESMLISVNVPGNLINVSNGRLISKKN
jgi:hypothetical protein